MVNGALHCPYCEGTSLHFMHRMPLEEKRPAEAVGCKNCEAVGPWGHTRLEAVARWNGRRDVKTFSVSQSAYYVEAPGEPVLVIVHEGLVYAYDAETSDWSKLEHPDSADMLRRYTKAMLRETLRRAGSYGVSVRHAAAELDVESLEYMVNGVDL